MHKREKYGTRRTPDNNRCGPASRKPLRHLVQFSICHMLVILLFAGSCKEPWFPEVEGLENTFIVEGLVTDMEGHSYVALNYYSPGSPKPYLPVRYAIVHVKDDLGNSFDFRHEGFRDSGRYVPLSPHFRAEAGRSYTLHIEMPGEGEYESAPQEILPPAKIDEVIARPVVRQVLLDDFRGRPQQTWIQGRDVFIGMSLENQDVLRLRIEPELLLFYTRNEVIPPAANIYYGWKKIRPAFISNFNLQRFGQESADFRDHLLCFLHKEKRNYNLKPDEHIHKYIMIIRYYTLNHESYRFHIEAEKQLSSENRLFDPVPGQLPTNIICLSHPGRPVAGFFEASSVRSETYLQEDQNPDYSYDFIRVEDMDLPVEGSWLNEKPPFWID